MDDATVEQLRILRSQIRSARLEMDRALNVVLAARDRAVRAEDEIRRTLHASAALAADFKRWLG